MSKSDADAKALVKKLEKQVKRLENEVQAAHAVTTKLENTALVARKFLEQRQADYAALHFQGAEIAASRGDTRPAEWALTHVKVDGQAAVEPPAKQATDTGTKVFIGINMGSMPKEAISAEIISVEGTEE